MLESYVVSGQFYLQTGDIGKAIFQFEKALKIDPQNALANYLMATAYERKGDKVTAEKYRTLAAKNNVVQVEKPKSGSGTGDGTNVKKPIDYLNEADAIYNNGDYEGAIEKYENLLKKYPGDGTLMYRLGTCYFALKQYPKAENYYLKGNSDIANLALAAGNNYWVQGKFKEALEVYLYYDINPDFRKKVAEVNPTIIAEAYSGAASSLNKMKMYNEALKYSKIGLEYGKHYLQYAVLGESYARLGQWQETLDAFTKARELSGDPTMYKKIIDLAKSKL